MSFSSAPHCLSIYITPAVAAAVSRKGESHHIFVSFSVRVCPHYCLFVPLFSTLFPEGEGKKTVTKEESNRLKRKKRESKHFHHHFLLYRFQYHCRCRERHAKKDDLFYPTLYTVIVYHSQVVVYTAIPQYKYG